MYLKKKKPKKALNGSPSLSRRARVKTIRNEI